MTFSIRTVKREIRILGLDTCRINEVLGAVVRGGYFLDGVIRVRLPDNHAARDLASEILASKYYPELRAIMLHDPGRRLKPSLLEKVARLPVIAASRTNRPGRRDAAFHSAFGTLFHQSRLPKSVVDKILSLTWTCGGLPEPARIAHILSKSTLNVQHGRGFGPKP